MSYLLFAAVKPEIEGVYVCETCNVLLDAANAEEAYRAAELWAKDHEETESVQFAGPEELVYIQDDRPGHGDEIAGSLFDEQDIWLRTAEFIPSKDRLKAIRFEGSDANKPIEELMDEQTKKRLKRVFDSE